MWLICIKNSLTGCPEIIPRIFYTEEEIRGYTEETNQEVLYKISYADYIQREKQKKSSIKKNSEVIYRQETCNLDHNGYFVDYNDAQFENEQEPQVQEIIQKQPPQTRSVRILSDKWKYRPSITRM